MGLEGGEGEEGIWGRGSTEAGPEEDFVEWHLKLVLVGGLVVEVVEGLMEMWWR